MMDRLQAIVEAVTSLVDARAVMVVSGTAEAPRVWEQHGLDVDANQVSAAAFCLALFADPRLVTVNETGMALPGAKPSGEQGTGCRRAVGLPLHCPTGDGRLCVFWEGPGTVTKGQMEGLKHLITVIELLLVEPISAFDDSLEQLTGMGRWDLDLTTQTIQWSAQTCRIHDVVVGHQPTLNECRGFYPPASRARMDAAIEQCRATGESWDIEIPLTTHEGRDIWVRQVGQRVEGKAPVTRLVGAIEDITFRKRAVAALEVSEKRFRKLFQDSLGLICTHDLKGVLLSVNPAAAASLGYPLSQLLGRPLTDFMREDLHPIFHQYLAHMERCGQGTGMLQLTAKDGSQRVWQYHNTLDSDGPEPYVLGHAQDISARLNYENQLREWSVLDPLTGCFNRRRLHQISQGLVEGEQWGCIAVDLNHFKAVNDTYGHQRGDEVLVAMSHFMRNHLGPADVLIRSGGDEFLILMPHAGPEQVQATMEQLGDQQAIAPIRFSMGHSVREGSETLDSALARADQALYQGRRARRGPAGGEA